MEIPVHLTAQNRPHHWQWSQPHKQSIHFEKPTQPEKALCALCVCVRARASVCVHVCVLSVHFKGPMQRMPACVCMRA